MVDGLKFFTLSTVTRALTNLGKDRMLYILGYLHKVQGALRLYSDS